MHFIREVASKVNKIGVIRKLKPKISSAEASTGIHVFDQQSQHQSNILLNYGASKNIGKNGPQKCNISLNV